MNLKKQYQSVHGWILLNKPQGISSFQSVNVVRRIFKVKKAGHSGTLDPLAIGMLPIALGEATKTMPYVINSNKQYEFIVKWGMSTDTGDSEGKSVSISNCYPKKNQITEVLSKFIGVINQTPPKFSAIKFNGKRAYALAREGKEVVLKPRKITIDNLKLLKIISNNKAKFIISCTKGTYIRAIAEDLASELGTVAHIIYLKRIKVGDFNQKNMISLEKLRKIRHNNENMLQCSNILMSVESVLKNIKDLTIDKNELKALKMGQKLLVQNLNLNYHEEITCFYNGILIAICYYDGINLKPKRVFNII